MNKRTGIEWTDQTWNPTTGCRKVSPGCDNCYAATLAKRLKAMGNCRYQNDGPDGPGFGLTMHWDKLNAPLEWRTARRIFVNSMSDLFHPGIPYEFLRRVFETMVHADWHQFQVLTKRPTYMARVVPRLLADLRTAPPKNVWLGTSVENQEWAERRIPHLLETPAAVRFLSCEPLLGPVSIRQWLTDTNVGREFSPAEPQALHWVIVGGESGPRHRPFDLSWARVLRDECAGAGIPFFFKQVGGRTAKAGGRILDGKTLDGFPTPRYVPA